jgi:hypothetical protein
MQDAPAQSKRPLMKTLKPDQKTCLHSWTSKSQVCWYHGGWKKMALTTKKLCTRCGKEKSHTRPE